MIKIHRIDSSTIVRVDIDAFSNYLGVTENVKVEYSIHEEDLGNFDEIAFSPIMAHQGKLR